VIFFKQGSPGICMDISPLNPTQKPKNLKARVTQRRCMIQDKKRRKSYEKKG